MERFLTTSRDLSDFSAGLCSTRISHYPMAANNISDDLEDRPLLFCERPDWADLTPLEQYENLTPIAPILYSEECKSKKKEFSIIFFFQCMLKNVLFFFYMYKTKMPPIIFEESLK